MQEENKQKYWLPILLSFVLASGFYLGYIIYPVISNRQGTELLFRSDKINPLEETLQLIRDNYVEAADLDTIYDAAIESVLSNLDPHSYYIPVKDMQGVQEEMSGNFEGIGVEFFIVRDTIQVVTPIPGGPSEQLGIQSGDKIIKVNDSTVAGIGIKNEDVLKKLKGPKGTKVKVSIQRNGRARLMDFNITRDKIPLYSVDGSFMIDQQTGFIKINRFSESTTEEFKNRLSSLMSQGMKNLIIDLRQNPGGYLQQAVYLINEIMGENRLIVYTEGRIFPKEEYFADDNARFNGKVAVLIDEGSASASEIVAGAIQDWDRGIIIGRRSFGKGLVQDQYMLSNGSALRLTIAKYYTPSGRCIQKSYANGKDKYHLDMQDRYENGEVFIGKDSTQTNKTESKEKYYTKLLKRPVYAGGGISPDIFVPFDTTYMNEFSMNALSQGMVQEFIYSYYSKQGPSLKKSYNKASDFVGKFVVSDELYKQFIAYCSNNGIRETGAYDPKAKAYICNRLKAFLAKQMFGNDALLMVSTEIDASVQQAMEAFKKKNLLEKTK